MSSPLKIGYARCSTAEQDLTAQKEELARLGVNPDRIYTDQGMSGKDRNRPGLANALAACRHGDTLVVTKLDRLGRSILDLRDIADTLIAHGVILQFGSAVYTPTDPMGKMFFNILATFAEFERDLIRMRTIDGLAVARAAGKLKGRKPKLNTAQQQMLAERHASGQHNISQLGRDFGISRKAVHRTLDRLNDRTRP